MIKVIGAGLAGCEAAYFLAEHGEKVRLYDMKPRGFTPAHSDKNFCELVCSNSLKGKDPYSNACGLLKEEMRILGSLVMSAAAASETPAGGALAVDRKKFAEYATRKITNHKNIEVVCERVEKLPDGFAIIATGPLTQGALADGISAICGGQLKFYDASAPIVARDGIDFDHCFAGDRYGKGGDDYLNCPLDKEQYDAFVGELVKAERVRLHDFEKGEIFEGCMPVEVLAARGKDSLRFAMLKPVGLRDGNKKFYAVLQLRKEDAAGNAYNLVGFQTNLKFSEQKRVFSMIPALKNAEFLRYGVMHANSYINSPQCLNCDGSLAARPELFFAGQITGVEGYVESAASGIITAVAALKKLRKEEFIPPDPRTMLGALCAYIRTKREDFQPMNANYGLLPPLDEEVRDKRERYKKLSERALDVMRKYKENSDI